MPQYDLAGNPLPDNNPPRTDLAGNPLPPAYNAPPPGGYGGAAPPQGGPYGAPQPGGYQQPQPGGYGAPQQPGAWPPSPGGYGGAPQQNTSGTNTGVPPEIGMLKWNWGAWFLGLFWTFFNGQPLLGGAIILLYALGFVPIVNYVTSFVMFGLHIYLGINGHQLSWKARRYDGGLPQFFDVQRAWMKWGIGLTLVSIPLTMILAAILFPVFAKARARAQMMNSGGGYTQPMTPPGGYSQPSTVPGQ